MIYLFIVLSIVIIAFLLHSEKEKNQLSVERISIRSKKIRTNKKIVFLSDLHDKCFGDNNSSLIELIASESPDYIFIGGDTVITKKNRCDLAVLDELLKKCTMIAPVIYANGNHEQRFFYEHNSDTYGKYRNEFLDILNRNDVVYLSDSSFSLSDICVYGLNLDEECYRDFVYKKIDRKYIMDKLGCADKKKFNILMAHSPMYLDVYEKWGCDLGLSGHFHGGVMRLGEKGVLSSQWQPFFKWCTGDFQIHNALFHVSRGLGGHTINVRINNLPELTVIDLKKE